MAIANLLIYLQLIMLFQQKTVRLYWQLLVLSGLEVRGRHGDRIRACCSACCSLCICSWPWRRSA